MTSAYGSFRRANGVDTSARLPYIPLRNVGLKDGTKVDVDFLRPEDVQSAMMMLNTAIDDGESWPFESPLTPEEFSVYFLSHAAFSVRLASTPEVVGVFYAKPNFPGRSGHFCNGGFITRTDFRRRGCGKLMGETYLRIARDLGYQAVLFNLVYKSNAASLRLWRSLGMVDIGTLPKVGRLTVGHRAKEAYVDAAQYYKDLTRWSFLRRSWGFLSGEFLRSAVAVFAGFLLGRSRHFNRVTRRW